MHEQLLKYKLTRLISLLPQTGPGSSSLDCVMHAELLMNMLGQLQLSAEF